MKRLLRNLLILITIGAATYVWLNRSSGRPPIRELTRGAEAGTVTAEEHFSPTEDLERIDYARLNQAQHTIDIAMYAFTDRYLAERLAEIARRGVKIRIYRDQSEYESEQQRGSAKGAESSTSILQGESNVQIRVKGKRELMHLKAYLVDGSLLRTGSANWSPSGLKRQDNNAHFTSDPAQIRAFQQTFEEMWSRTGNVVVQ